MSGSELRSSFFSGYGDISLSNPLPHHGIQLLGYMEVGRNEHSAVDSGALGSACGAFLSFAAHVADCFSQWVKCFLL